MMEIPQMAEPKLLKTVIKYKITKKCCSKVLVVDSDHFSVLVLSIFFEK